MTTITVHLCFNPLYGMFVGRFDGQWRLLVRALLSVVNGAHRALEVFLKQQRVNSDISLHQFIEILCQEEVTCIASAQLTVKPLVCLFPALFRQNLLAFICHVHNILPRTSVLHLLECLKQDPHQNIWVSTLVTQLERQLNIDNGKPLFSAQCGQRLAELSQRFDSGKSNGWVTALQTAPSSSAPKSGSSELSTQKKRKSSAITQDSDNEESSQQNKRMKVDLCGSNELNTEQEEIKNEELEDAAAEVSTETSPPQPDQHGNILPENIKVAVLRLKDLLESHSEWDHSSSDVVKVLNDCDPAQVEVVCDMLNLPNIPEQTLTKLCSSVLVLSPDLSYSTATTFLKSLLLEKALSLSEPASRCLVSAVTSLCSRYPRPMCHALFQHVLENKNIGNLQADLVNKLIESCLDLHYKLLVLKMTLETQWNEAVLSIIHCLLTSKLDINEEVFTQLTEQLMNQASQFTKSMKFAKMLLIVLTKYSSNVTADHNQTLSSCLMLNDTFLKKSLQAALKKITHT